MAIQEAVSEGIRHVFENERHREGRFTRAIEHQTAKVPSGAYLNLALVSIVGAVGIAVYTRRAEWANFVGLWAPAFMLVGIYNKLVKQEELH